MLTQQERDRLAAQWFPFQLSVQSSDGTWKNHGGYTSKAKAANAARYIFDFDAFDRKPIRITVHHHDTGRLIISKKR